MNTNNFLIPEAKYNSILWILETFILPVLSIALMGFQIFYPTNTDKSLILSIAIIIFLFCYILWMHQRRLHRYAISGVYMHAVVHIMRDFLARLRINSENASINATINDEFKKTIEDCLNLISEFFTLISRHRCSVCLKELSKLYVDEAYTNEIKTTEVYIIKTLARNQLSKIERDKVSDDFNHILDDNTDFENIFNLGDNYFFSNNLVKLWEEGKYKNSTLLMLDKKKDIRPHKEKYWVFSKWVWPLNYKSTMVFPIRFLEKNEYFGFLCVDAKKENTFRFRYDIYFGANFADLFHTFLTQYYFLTDADRSPRAHRKRNSTPTRRGKNEKV
jgi:hypothetical protein